MRMPFFKPKTKLDKAFEIGILLKGLDGFIETIGGIILLFLNPAHINHIARLLTTNELNENPHNFLSVHLLHWAGNLTKASLLFGAIYLLAHGVAKLGLVFEIIRNRLWAYPGLIILTGLFVIYQTYEIFFSYSLGLILLTVFDLIIIYLTVREYKKQKEHKRNELSSD
jgi:uncharacterized membrane protein